MTREEAIMAVKEVTGMSLPWNDRHYEALQMAIKALEEPKRKKGKWISNGREDCYECSECHAVIEGDEVYWRNNYFCYHCGADMRGEENGE